MFTFSGHGSWLPDDDRDEPDARDEMMCPHDVMKEQYLLDDELHEIFCTKHAGARHLCDRRLVSFRIGRRGMRPRRPQPDSAPLKARFLPPYVFARGNRLFERAIDRAINTPAPTKLRYPAVLFSGCQDTEFSYDTVVQRAAERRVHAVGDRRAAGCRASTTPRALHDAIRQKLPAPSLPQTPQLFGSRDAKLGRLF